MHDATMAELQGREWVLDDDLQAHVAWSERTKLTLTVLEIEDLRNMLAVRGVLEAPAYDDEPTRGSAGLRGGGGRKRGAGMRPPVESKRRRSSTAGADGQEHTEPPADEAARGDLPEPPPVVGRTMTREMAGSSASGWFCGLLRRHIGIAVARPAWYMAGDALAARAGVQIAATCGLHSVNHALHTLNGFVPHTWQAFDGRARADERKPDGDWEYSALQRNVEAAGARMCPVQAEEHETLVQWVSETAAPHFAIWRPGHVGCVMHTPGHWVALTPPDGPQTPECAALLCDSLRPRPYALSAEELGMQ